MTDRQDPTGVSLTRDAPARAAFRYSILYLFALFGVLAVDHLAAGYLPSLMNMVWHGPL
jgi:protoheme IX farnesyltransferase